MTYSFTWRRIVFGQAFKAGAFWVKGVSAPAIVTGICRKDDAFHNRVTGEHPNGGFLYVLEGGTIEKHEALDRMGSEPAIPHVFRYGAG
jgi:hypothetical protein